MSGWTQPKIKNTNSSLNSNAIWFTNPLLSKRHANSRNQSRSGQRLGQVQELDSLAGTSRKQNPWQKLCGTCKHFRKYKGRVVLWETTSLTTTTDTQQHSQNKVCQVNHMIAATFRTQCSEFQVRQRRQQPGVSMHVRSTGKRIESARQRPEGLGFNRSLSRRDSVQNAPFCARHNSFRNNSRGSKNRIRIMYMVENTERSRTFEGKITN